MTKKLKIYQILTFALGLAFVGLCLFVGITAVQKSMKLNLSFAANPIVFCQVLVNEEVIFDNSEKIIDDGVSLSGNVLTFNSTVSENVTLGENFDLKIKNYSTTGSAIHISFNGATISTGDVVNSTIYSEIIASNNFSEVLSVSTNEMRISMTKVTPVTLSLGAGVALTSSNILTSTSGAQCLPFGEDLQATISLESSYENPKFTFNGNTYNITNNQLTISAEDLTGGNTNVEIEAEKARYTINFNANGGSGSMASVMVAAGESYTLPANTFTFSPHNFISWNTAADGSGTSYNAGTSVVDLTATGGQVTLYAQWTCTATFTITTGSSSRAAYVGYVITNDPGLTFTGKSYDVKFKSISTGGNSDWEYLQYVTPGSTPIRDAQSGTGYYYKEVYYNTASQTFTTYPEVNPGDYIFIFGMMSGDDGNMTYVSCIDSYSTSPNIECRNVITYAFSYGQGTRTLVIGYVMPNYDIQFNATYSYAYN